MWPLFLALVLLSLTRASRPPCESLTFPVAENESCLELARLANPAAFVQFPNRTCAFYNVCGNTTIKIKGSSGKWFESCVDFSKKKVSVRFIDAEMMTRTSTRPFANNCPKFEKVVAKRRVLLLRTHAAFGESPYRLLCEGPISPEQVTDAQSNKERKNPFKSPLLAIANLSSLLEAHVEMLDEKGRSQTRFNFRVLPQDRLPEGRWFAKDRLIASSWPMSYLRGKSRFNVFSMYGNAYQSRGAVRRFHIGLMGGRCQKQRGLMAVVEKAACPWEQGNNFFPAYVYMDRRGFGVTWAVSKREAAEFRIYGVFSGKAEMFVRRSQKC